MSRDFDDALTLIERQESMFASGNKYTEYSPLIVNKEEDYYRTFEQKLTATGFNFTYNGEIRKGQP